MKTSDINRIIEKYSPAEARTIFESYKAEFEEYKKAISKLGASVYFNVVQDEPLVIKKAKIINLANYFLNRDLMEIEINFLVDNIIAADAKFENEKVFEIIESFTDPAINGNLTDEYVNNILSELK